MPAGLRAGFGIATGTAECGPGGGGPRTPECLRSDNVMSGRIIVTGDKATIPEDFLGRLTDAGFKIDRIADREPSEAVVKAKLAGAVGYVFGGFEYLDADCLAIGAPTLKCVSLLGEDATGFLNVDVAASLNIAVTTTPGATTRPVAEYATVQTINGLRRLTQASNLGSSGDKTPLEPTPELRESHIGIVGLGRIGTRAAEIFRVGLGAKVSYWNRTRKENEEAVLGIAYASIDALFATCDAVVVCVSAVDATRKLVGDDVLRRAKPGLVVVVVSKSQVVDLVALEASFAGGRVTQAVFDWIHSPGQETALKSLKQRPTTEFVVTPHIANNTIAAWRQMTEMATASLINVLRTGKDEYLYLGNAKGDVVG